MLAKKEGYDFIKKEYIYSYFDPNSVKFYDELKYLTLAKKRTNTPEELVEERAILDCHLDYTQLFHSLCMFRNVLYLKHNDKTEEMIAPLVEYLVCRPVQDW